MTTPQSDKWHELRIVVGAAAGLHARPAAAFVHIVCGFDADVEVVNLTTGRGPAPASSITSLAILGVVQGHEISVRARGGGAREVLSALAALAERGFDEHGALPTQILHHQPTVNLGGPGDVIRGFAAAPGVVLGPARKLRRAVAGGPRPQGTPTQEAATLTGAIALAQEEVRRTRDVIASQAGPEHAAILDTQVMILGDTALSEPALAAIQDGVAAEDAWKAAVGAVVAQYQALPDLYQRARASDIQEVGRQVLGKIAGAAAPPTLNGPGILIAPDLGPAETAGLDPAIVLGIATAGGGPTSHSSILARALGVPAVVGLGDHILTVVEGTPLLLDGAAGTLIIDPDARAIAAYEAQQATRIGVPVARGPRTVTWSGEPVIVSANVGTVADARMAAEYRADGIGLLRTEFLFAGRATPPTEAEQVHAYREIAEAMGGRPVTLRTLDAGGDKPLAYLDHPAEANPMLGLRGIRLLLRQREILRTQLRAALRVAADHPLRIMFPMVTTIEEWREVRAILGEEEAAMGVDVQAGMMVETPAAAICADAFAPEVDFFSIGTNDLTQYVMAADRGNPATGHLAGPLHAAVLRLIEEVCAAAADHGRPVSLCGELAGDPEVIGALLLAGVRDLSVAPPMVAPIRSAIGI